MVARSRIHANPGKMYNLIKAHKVGNFVRVITSGCSTAIENLSIFIETCLYSEVLKTEGRVSEMITIIDKLTKSNTLASDCRLESFDNISTFPGIDNISGLKAVKRIFDARQDQFHPTVCII